MEIQRLKHWTLEEEEEEDNDLFAK